MASIPLLFTNIRWHQHGSISTNLMAWQHFQQVMNVEELTFIVANLVLVWIHLLVHHVLLVLLGEKKNNEIAKFPTSVRH